MFSSSCSWRFMTFLLVKCYLDLLILPVKSGFHNYTISVTVEDILTANCETTVEGVPLKSEQISYDQTAIFHVPQGASTVELTCANLDLVTLVDLIWPRMTNHHCVYLYLLSYSNYTCTYTQIPTQSPTNFPTHQPTKHPTHQPTQHPTRQPTPPTSVPTKSPTKPTTAPTLLPTKHPTNQTSMSSNQKDSPSMLKTNSIIVWITISFVLLGILVCLAAGVAYYFFLQRATTGRKIAAIDITQNEGNEDSHHSTAGKTSPKAHKGEQNSISLIQAEEKKEKPSMGRNMQLRPKIELVPAETPSQDSGDTNSGFVV